MLRVVVASDCADQPSQRVAEARSSADPLFVVLPRVARVVRGVRINPHETQGVADITVRRRRPVDALVSAAVTD